MTARAFWADGLVLGDGASLVDGAVVVDDAGTIVDVGPAAAVLPRHGGVALERLRGVLLPGLVNAHTHVELSALRGHVTGGAGFVPWVERFIGARAELPSEDEHAAIESAVADLLRFGTAAVGDISNALTAVRPLARAGIGGSVFHEVFGTDRGRVLGRIEALEKDAEEALAGFVWGDLRYAPTPHTLYTTHPDGVRALLAKGRLRGGLMSLHFLEHDGERRALETGTGPVVEWLGKRVGLTPEQAFWPHGPALDYAESLGAIGPDVLLVHLTVARADELRRIAEAGAPVVLCPRSNLYIETRLPPLLAVLEAGIEPALGTDSLASNTSLDVLADAVSLAERFPAIAADRLLRMATWNGAVALGRPDLGRVAVGARPGLFLVEPPAGTKAPATGAEVGATVLRHAKAPRRWVVRRPS